MRHPHGLRAAAGAGGFDPNTPIGTAIEGGFFAGLISHTADGVATHALIVAPRATGASGTGYPITTNLRWKTTASTTTGTGSAFDGAANTAAMVAAGIASHPAAQFCVNLSIGGYSDWYLPARFELDIAYQNLKPTTTSNSTSHGINPYSVPERTVNRTSGNPAQTSVSAFQSTGAERFEFASSVNHWSSQEFSSAFAWVFIFDDGRPSQVEKSQTFPLTRAFRKVAL
jgi:hypothetical protein